MDPATSREDIYSEVSYSDFPAELILKMEILHFAGNTKA